MAAPDQLVHTTIDALPGALKHRDPLERLFALADLHEATERLRRVVEQQRGQALRDLVEQVGLESAAAMLGVSTWRIRDMSTDR